MTPTELRKKMDHTYYNDPMIQRNRSILKQFGPISDEGVLESKVYYFLTRGVSAKIISEAYGVRFCTTKENPGSKCFIIKTPTGNKRYSW